MPAERDETLRDRILARDEYRCAYCGQLYPAEALTLDHVEPKMRGGDRSEGNLVAACQACNARKGSLPAWAFLAEDSEARENFLRLARHVWPRLRRAIEEAAEKGGGRRRRP